MKKNYEKAIVEIVKFDEDDKVTTNPTTSELGVPFSMLIGDED